MKVLPFILFIVLVSLFIPAHTHAAPSGVLDPNKFLEVSLSYDSNEGIEINSAHIKKGTINNLKFDVGNYTLKVFDSKETVISEYPFTLPNNVECPPPLDTNNSDCSADLESFNFTINIPYFTNSSYISITNPNTDTHVNANISLDLTGRSFSDVNVHTYLPNGGEYNSENAAGYLDIVIVADGFNTNNINLYNQLAQSFINKLTTFSPFNSNIDKLAFHIVENTSDLECGRFSPDTNRLITCDNSYIINYINDLGYYFYDNILVISNDFEYGGSGNFGSKIAVTYSGTYSIEVLIHEFGHSFGNLRDEYTLYTNNGVEQSFTYFNCYMGEPPAQEWEGVVEISDYYLGCTYPNWYRSSYDSIMRTINASSFNQVSINLLTDKIEETISSPIGEVYLEGYEIKGWACDINDYSLSINVFLYVQNLDGTEYEYMGSYLADDVLENTIYSSKCSGFLKHGFRVDISKLDVFLKDTLTDGNQKSILVHAVDIDKDGEVTGSTTRLKGDAIFKTDYDLNSDSLVNAKDITLLLTNKILSIGEDSDLNLDKKTNILDFIKMIKL